MTRNLVTATVPMLRFDNRGEGSPRSASRGNSDNLIVDLVTGQWAHGLERYSGG